MANQITTTQANKHNSDARTICMNQTIHSIYEKSIVKDISAATIDNA